MKKGFTLAEVLITLVIIGIIAAMTIPTLMNKTNEQESVVALKKAYSIVSQAYKRVIAENGEINPETLNGNDASKNLSAMFVPYFSVQKVCGHSSEGDCFAGMYKKFNGTDWWNGKTDISCYKMRLSDGMSLAIFGFPEYKTFGNGEPLTYVFGQVYIDLNGDKGPNTLGKDMFIFYISKYGVFPFGMPDDTSFPFSDCRNTGAGCAAWVITKGNMDYLHKDVSW